MRQVIVGILGSLLLCMQTAAQQPDTLIRKLDSLKEQRDSAGRQVNNTERTAYNEATRINAGTYFILLGSDFKQQLTKPFHMRGKDWIKFGLFAAGTGTLMLVDEPVQKFALRLRTNNAGVRDLSSYVTRFGGLYEAYVLAGLGTYGFVFNNKKMQTTTLLATQSYITSAVAAALIKTITGRQRPVAYDPSHLEAEPRFHGPFFRGGYDKDGKRINTSFPSGHTTAAFSAATVYAMEYRDRPWVPVLAYSAATLIGLSRITENKHWMTDVVAGAALGFLTGHQVVNNYHRYSKLRSPAVKKNTVVLNLGYSNGLIMPGIIYRFR